MKKPLFLSLILLISVTICFAQPCSVQLNIDNPVYCYGICGAAIEAQATGTGNLTYVWSPNVSTNSLATDLCPGKYKVTMTDANNCKAVDSLVLGQPDTLNVTATVTNVKCFGVCNGKISIVVTGGTSLFNIHGMAARIPHRISTVFAPETIALPFPILMVACTIPVTFL